MPFSYDINPSDSARAKRRMKSHTSDDVEVKALGSNLGQIARGQAVYDPNAYDGDGDGVVQDSTPFERPAALSNVAALSRGFASATGRWGDTFDKWTVGKTNEEIAEVAVPDNPADLIAYITAHVGVHGLPTGFDNIDDLLKSANIVGANFDPETIARTRAMLVRMLEKNPDMREFIDRFGIPATIVQTLQNGVGAEAYKHVLISLSQGQVDTDQKLKPKWMTAYGAIKDTLIKKFGDDVIQAITPEGVDTLPDTYLQDDSRGFLENTFIHEYGHYLHYQALLNHPNPDFRKEMFFMYNASWGQLEGSMEAQDSVRTSLLALALRMAKPMERMYSRWDPQGRTGIRRADPMSDIMPPSAYAATKPTELMAELFVQYVKTADKKTLNPETRILMETLTGRKTPATGFFSASQTLPGSREFDDKSIEDIVDAVVPSTPEQARKELETWSQWMFDSAGDGYFDVDTEGMTAAQKVDLELKRMKFHLDKNMEGSWSRVLRKARRYKGEVKPEDVFDFSEESLMGLRDMVSEALNNSPEFLNHVRDFGMPPLFVFKGDDVQLGGIFNGSTGAMFIAMNRLSLDPTPLEDVDSARARNGKKLANTEWYLESNGKWKPQSILYHEYGHFVNYLASAIHPDREVRYLASWYWRMDWNEGYGWRARRKWQKFRKENPGFKYDAADRRWQQIEEITDAINSNGTLDWENGPPHVLSQYGQGAPAETFAEGYGAWMSGDPEQIARVSPALMNDLKMHFANTRPDETTVEVDMTQAMQRPTGFASLSIKRDEYGTRDLAAALDGSSPSPLDGSNWLENATPREIAQAIVPRSREDAVNLMLMNLLTGNRNPDPMTMAAMRSILSKMLDTDIFDFSPEGVSQMEKWIEKALDESPQFLWQVRRFGSLPMIPTDRKAVRKYKNALDNGTPIPIISMNGARTESITYPFTTKNLSAEQEAMKALFDGSVASPGTMGYCVGSLFMVMNMHHREWRGIWDPQRSGPPKFGRTRRVLMGVGKTPGEVRPFPARDKYGRLLVSNFGTSLEGTIIHEWSHGWFTGLFGPKQGLAIVPEITQEVADRGGVLAPNARVRTRDLYRLGGGRNDRYAYFFPGLSRDEAEARIEYAKEFMSPGSLTIIPVPESPDDISFLIHFMRTATTKAMSVYGAGSPEVAEINQRLNDYGQELGDRGLQRIRAITSMANMSVSDFLYRIGIDPNDPDQVQSAAIFYGYEPGINQDTWKDLASDFPEIFGDPSLPFATLAGQYAQKNPQETWAELNIQMAQPDADYRDEYITPELKAALLYVMGEHDDPFDINIPELPWEKRGGFASRTQRVEHARETVVKRSSNTLGNVVSSRSTIDDRASRVVKSTRDERGHTRFEIGDYTFTIPGDKFMPDLSSAYTEWASESHYGIQQMSRMMMGVQPSKKNPLSMPGNVEINAIRSGRGVSELGERTLSSIRSTAAKTNRILDEIRDGDSHSSMPLYHAVNAVEQDSDILSASIGDTISMPLSSFSPNFINPNIVTNRGGGDGSAVIKLAIGAKVMESNLLENINHNNEWRDVPIESITGGKFKVVSKGEKDGIPVIEIEQTDIFDTSSGQWMNVDPKDAMSSIRYEVNTDRGLRELEKLNKRRVVLADGDPEYGTITEQMESLTNDVVRNMFGGDTEQIDPVLSMSSSDRINFEKQMELLSTIPISSMDKRGLPGFASVTDAGDAFARRITPERRVRDSAIRMLQENREYISERNISGRMREDLNDVWVDRTIDKLKNEEMTHTDAMNLMNVIMDVISGRIKKDPSVRDATDGDVYNYQKLGKRLRRDMANSVTPNDIASAKREQVKGFASDTVNTDKRVTERFNPTVISTQASDAEWGEFEMSRRIVQANVYDINGEKVAFGIEERHGLDTTGIKVIELNPYEITGLERGTPEGEEMALDWVYADSYMFETGSQYEYNGTEISALLYAATKGDKEAEKQFKEYAEKGRALLAQKRQEEMDAERESLDGRLTDPGVRQSIKSLQTRLAALRQEKEKGYYTGDPSEEDIANAKITTKDLVLVRWSQFPPEYDDEGNLIIHPASKYMAVDRETIHFTLNHAVEEHMFWTEGEEGGYLIMSRLSDVIEANGLESLDNLYAIDTYFTPKAGGLKIPKPNVRRVEKGEDRQSITQQILKDEFETIGFKGGPHYAETAGADDTIRLVARDLNIPPGTLHASQPHKNFEQFNNYTDGNGNRNLAADANNQAPYTFAPTISGMQRNALLAIADRKHAKWSGVNQGSIKNPAGSFVSASRLRSRRVVDMDMPVRGEDTPEFVAREMVLSERALDVLRTSMNRSLEAISSGRMNNYTMATGSEPHKSRLLNALRVVMSKNDVPMLVGDPHPTIFTLVPDKRDWSQVEIPSDETVQRAIQMMRDNQDTLEMTYERAFDGEASEKFYTIIGRKLGIIRAQSGSQQQPTQQLEEELADEFSILSGDSSWAQLYLSSLFSNDDWAPGATAVDELIHDAIGHVGIGRGFDRHGEFANALAIISLLKDSDVIEQLSEKERASVARGIISNYLVFTLMTNENDKEIKLIDKPDLFKLGRSFRGNPFELIDILESEIDKTPALNNDGSPIVPRSTGFASANRLSLEDMKPDMRERIVIADASHISRNKTTPRVPGKTPDEITASISKVVNGFASRGVPVNPAGKSTEDVAREIELTPDEIDILEQVLPDISSMEEMAINPSLEERKEEIIDSVRVTVGEDGVPFVYAMPHPLLADEIPDKRDWSAVVRPKKETAEKVKALFAKIISDMTGNGDALDEFWESSREGGDRYDEITKKDEDAKLLRYLFSDWASKLLDGVAEKNPFDKESNDYVSGLYAGQMGGMPTFLKMWAQGIQDLKAPELNTFVGLDAFLNAHDVWGHVGTGRGFDRHGEWTNMLAMFSLMDRWAKENNVSKDDLTITKASWFQALEYSRISGEFTPDREELQSRDKWWIHAHASSIAPSYASIEQLEELIKLIDDGNTHDTGKSVGLASASNVQKAEIVKTDIVRQTLVHGGAVDTKPAVFASKAGDFRPGTHNIEIKIDAPKADMFVADEKGRIVQVLVPEGVEVANPRTGKKMTLDSPSASTEFLADGGNISEVPDAHAIEAILGNTEDVPGEEKTGWRFSKPGGRFEWVDGGGGGTGMIMLRDKSTNALFGIKYEASFIPLDGDKWGEEKAPYPIKEYIAADAPIGIINEVIGQAVLQALGFEPGATRIVRRSPLGAGADRTRGRLGGIAMIIDFAQNRHPRVYGQSDYEPGKVRKESAIRMLFLDSILANTDRNLGNFLTSKQSDGSRVIIPIDHGLIMGSGINKWDFKDVLIENVSGGGWGATPIKYEQILYEDLSKAELEAMIPKILADYRTDIEQKKADIVKAMDEAIEKVMSLHQEGDFPSMKDLIKMADEYQEKIEGILSRLDEVASMSNEEFLKIFTDLRIGYK